MTQEELRARMYENRYRKPDFWERNFAKIFSFIGVALLLGSLGIAAYNYNFMRQAKQTVGEVIRLDGGAYKQGYAPVIQYFDEENMEHLYYSTEFSRPPRYRVGQKVDMYFKTTDPEDASMGFSWLAILVLGGIGIVFTFFGIIFQKAFVKPAMR